VIWFLGVGQWGRGHYFEKLECIWVIARCDIARASCAGRKDNSTREYSGCDLYRGPILRRFNLSKLKFETAGIAQVRRTNAVGRDHRCTRFRNQILKRANQLKRQALQPHQPALAHDNDLQTAQLDALKKIDERLSEIAELLRKRN
jgi:putative membrane protein